MGHCVLHGTLVGVVVCTAAATARLWVNTQRVSVGGGAYVLRCQPRRGATAKGPQRSENERTTLRTPSETHFQTLTFRTGLQQSSVTQLINQKSHTYQQEKGGGGRRANTVWLKGVVPK